MPDLRVFEVTFEVPPEGNIAVVTVTAGDDEDPVELAREGLPPEWDGAKVSSMRSRPWDGETIRLA